MTSPRRVVRRVLCLAALLAVIISGCRRELPPDIVRRTQVSVTELGAAPGALA